MGLGLGGLGPTKLGVMQDWANKTTYLQPMRPLPARRLSVRVRVRVRARFEVRAKIRIRAKVRVRVRVRMRKG